MSAKIDIINVSNKLQGPQKLAQKKSVEYISLGLTLQLKVIFFRGHPYFKVN